VFDVHMRDFLGTNCYFYSEFNTSASVVFVIYRILKEQINDGNLGLIVGDKCTGRERSFVILTLQRVITWLKQIKDDTMDGACDMHDRYEKYMPYYSRIT
jgi:hypothetical protein